MSLGTTIGEHLRGLRKLSEKLTTEFTENTEEKAEIILKIKVPPSFFCELRLLRAELSDLFGCGSAALGLRGETTPENLLSRGHFEP